MSDTSRRTFLVGAGASLALTAACANGTASRGADRIDARVDATMNYLFYEYPDTRELDQKAVGKLVMPVVTKAGLGLGAAYGRGALRINNSTVDYYSATSGSLGLQIGAQQYSHALFFMNEAALANFRSSPGWVGGADAEFVLRDNGQNVSTDTVTALNPVIALIFAQAGLSAGATVNGTKYTRIIP